MNLEAGLSAVKPALPEESQKQVEAVLAAITPVIKAARDEKTISKRVAFMIRDMNRSIESAVGDFGDDADEGEGFSAGEPAAVAAPVDAPAVAGAAPTETPATPPAAEAPGPEAPPAEAPAAPAPAQPEGAKN
jgi:hypothetical protein